MYAEENPPHHRWPIHIHRHRARGGSGCCCCLDCICDCLVGCIISAICTVLVIVGLVVLIFYLIVRPHEINFHVTDASLTKFSLSSTTTSTSSSSSVLSYSLSLSFSARNPNRHVGVYYDTIDVRAYYNDQIFAATGLTGFYQGHKNTSSLGPAAFSGQNAVELGSGDVKDFNNEKSEGVFQIEVKLYLRVRFKIGIFKTGHYKPRVDCDLKVPLQGAGTEYVFQSTKCHYHL